jgi:EAL domain-containing protein (putative c-di-GMP-specific phosphodiesterase class I)/ActR/RegA family two-component response regulator
MLSAEAQIVPTEAPLLDAILEAGRLRVAFQPIFEVGEHSPALFGLECLIRGPRGTNAERPAVLFEYVRRKRAEAAVDRACVGTALAEAGRLPGRPRLSVNVHASTLGRDLGFPCFLLECAQDAGIDARRLVVEIVEHSPPLDVPSFRRALEALREAHVTIALDDVGLGQSNYKMILDVRPQIYKLDRYLVSGAWADPYRQVILDSLVRMVRRLEARAVAEGVENRRELVAVEAAGIDLVQGFLFAPPLSAPDLLAAGHLAATDPATDREGDGSPRLLVLDDDPAILSVLATYFGAQGWQVEACADAAGALRRIGSRTPFDAVICDLHFTPAREAEGLEIVARARERMPRAAVVLFTAAGDADAHEAALRRGADEVIAKPAPLASLRDAALRAMKKP